MRSILFAFALPLLALAAEPAGMPAYAPVHAPANVRAVPANPNLRVVPALRRGIGSEICGKNPVSCGDGQYCCQQGAKCVQGSGSTPNCVQDVGGAYTMTIPAINSASYDAALSTLATFTDPRLSSLYATITSVVGAIGTGGSGSTVTGAAAGSTNSAGAAGMVTPPNMNAVMGSLFAWAFASALGLVWTLM